MSGIVFIALFFTAAGASASAAASMEFSQSAIHPSIARQLPVLSRTILLVFAMRMAAMFVFATSNIGRTAVPCPDGSTLGGYLVGLFLLLSATFNSALVLVFPLWILALCAILFVTIAVVEPFA